MRFLIASFCCLCLVGCDGDDSRSASPPSPATPGTETKSPLTTGGATTGTAAPKSAPKPPAADPQPTVKPLFVEVAVASGIDLQFFTDAVPGRYFLPEIMGGGIAWLDFDGDGRLDAFFRNGTVLDPKLADGTPHLSRLYRNVGRGQFADATSGSTAGHEAYGQGAAAADYDADGFPDLYLSNFGEDVLLHNNGDGTYSNVTSVAGVSNPDWSTSAVWCDLDDDHDLDLYVCNYMDVSFANHKACEYSGKPGYCGPGSYHSRPDAVYLNQGDGTFVESAARLGFVDENGNGLAVVAADFDDDLRLEIFVANDMTPNHMFTRSTHFDAPDAARLLYSNVAPAGGSAVSYAGLNEAGMGISTADFDGDGLLDIFVTHYYHQKNTLYHNRGQLVFDDDSRRTRIATTSYESLGFGTCPIDFDRDGDPDLFVANGHVLGPEQEPNAMRPQLLMNHRGQFYDISELAGAYFRKLLLGRGVAGADYDDDGDLDIAVSHLDQRVALLRNDTRTGRHFLGFDLRTPDRMAPVGGRVVIRCGEHRQVLPVAAGGSYLSSPDPRLLAGLPDDGPCEVEVHWPSGRVDRYTDLKPDRYWLIVEGGAPRELPAGE